MCVLVIIVVAWKQSVAYHCQKVCPVIIPYVGDGRRYPVWVEKVKKVKETRLTQKAPHKFLNRILPTTFCQLRKTILS